MTLQEKETKITQIIRELKKVKYPGYSRDIVSFGFIKKIDVDNNGKVFVDLEVPTEKEEVFEEIRTKVQEVLKSREDVEVSIRKKEIFKRQPLPIKGKSIAVYSTKGGVGKSTVSVNLAYSISKMGLKTSILDLDVHGPSVPKITGTEDYEPYSPDGKNIQPAEKKGVKIMSIGFMAKGDTPVIWRGPMVMKAFRTLTFSTFWPDTEVLVIDLPPGSGDIQLSLAQEADISGMVMITTPQELALEDLKRGIVMFKKLSIPIVGVVENMSYFTCDSCGKKHFIFGKDGGKKVAEQYGIEFIGQIPFDPQLLELSDSGRIFVLEKNNETTKAFDNIAEKIISKMNIHK